jgi:hypothetical protein
VIPLQTYSICGPICSTRSQNNTRRTTASFIMNDRASTGSPPSPKSTRDHLGRDDRSLWCRSRRVGKFSRLRLELPRSQRPSERLTKETAAHQLGPTESELIPRQYQTAFLAQNGTIRQETNLSSSPIVFSEQELRSNRSLSSHPEGEPTRQSSIVSSLDSLIHLYTMR